MSGITQDWRCWCSSLVMTSVLIASLQDKAFTQITPDNTLPKNSSVAKDGNTFNITGGTQAESNLFHSFSDFSVPPNGTASFNNAADIQNIISRVTGSSVSNIDGLIRASGKANLFLINPNGIIFGEEARLDIGGSFIVTTANAIGFGDRGFFSATNPNSPQLLTVNPSAFLFNQIAAAPIQNNSIARAGVDPAGYDAFGLRVPDGKSLLLVGGDVSMNGGELNAYGGRVELGGLSEPGTITLGVEGDNLSLKFPSNVARTSVSLTNQAAIYVEAAGGANIAVNAKNLDILEGSLLSAGIGQDLGTSETVAGDIALNATGEIKVAGGSIVRNLVNFGSKGNGGSITIDSGSFSLSDGAGLVASTFGQGSAGNVTVRARDAVSLTNAYISSTVSSGGVGKGGNIDINAATLSLIDGAQLQTITRSASATQPAGRGDAGNVNVNVTGIVDIAGEKNGFFSGILNFVGTGTVGNGGNITIDSGSFSLGDRARFEASTYGQGNAGNVTVRARDAVSLADNAVIVSAMGAGSVGKKGNIDINAATLSLIDGAQLLTITRGVSATQPPGREDTGNVNVNVTGIVDIAGEKNGFFSGIISSVETGTVGNGGNITINSASFSLRDRAQLAATTYGQGNAGNVTVSAKDSVSLAADAIIFSTVEPGGEGKGGNIDINAATLSLIDGAQLQTITRGASATQPAGQGDAGNVKVNVTGIVDIAGSGIGSEVETGTFGNGGNITIDSGSFSLRDRAFLSASTSTHGNAGNVTVRARDAVLLEYASIFSTVEAGGVGNGGNIDINATTLSLIDGGQLLTVTRDASDTQPAGQGNAGNVNVNVTGIVDIAGEKNGLPGAIGSFVYSGTVGNGGNITIDSGSFSLRDRAFLAASTYGQGNAGNVTVQARDTVSLADASIYSTVEPGGVGKGGNININAATLSLIDGAELQALTSGRGNAGNVTVQARDTVSLTDAYILSTVEDGSVGQGGNININAATLSLIDGAQLQTITRGASATQPAGQGDAGNVNVNVTGAVNIAGEKNGLSSAIASSVETGTQGNGGNITIDSGSFSLRDGAELQASTSGQGNAGAIKVNAADFFTISSTNSDSNSGLFVNSQSPTGTARDIIVISPRVTLDNGGTLNAQSASGNGGNINLQTDSLFLHRGASISTTAGTAQAGGNGGNIIINATNGFILAVPSENSDITANAFTGSGGRVDIQATGIYGIEFRESPTVLSDITASSEFGTQGTVELNTPDVDPNSGLVQLPTTPVDTQVAQGCYSPDYAQNRFVIAGRGGLPPNPKDILTPDAPQIDWVSVKPTNNNRSTPPVSSTTISTPKRIVEATGATLNAKGQIVLSANSSAAPYTFRQNPIQCHGS
ncbi:MULTISPECIES: filamentous hemagglutinin N-terminal domain-containing protein [unclassified Nostoc]|uniref:two-partner secretion domain-containing protein n=1 Tax=unclassified Nostoc TaxID=2593658 RepID=UPI002AD32A20|nr:filamentous hemagglutinin N-terminal domain-containing protein [Nostoc sp. DedQUE03]MDZ7975740.1 filamentous hemagglutinin N-terminal domain-containing protein [Nostoc sp. DedQUE03]MDZ8048443.1 filamentous hemagglutinin N-terminal domain-containing protein [Nostoc sp. DedQUE02]